MPDIKMNPKQFLDLKGYSKFAHLSRSSVETLLHEYHKHIIGREPVYDGDFFTLQQIDKRVAESFCMATVKSKSRGRKNVSARLLYFTIARINNFSFKEIGACIEKDHATVMHGIRRFFYIFRKSEDVCRRAKQICSEHEFATMCHWANTKYK